MASFLDVALTTPTPKVQYKVTADQAQRTGTSLNDAEVTFLAQGSEDPLLDLYRTRERAQQAQVAAEKRSILWQNEIAALDAVLGDYEPPVIEEPDEVQPS